MTNLLPVISLFAITFISGTVAFFLQHRTGHAVKMFLSFSGAFLLSICVIHLLPELFETKAIDVAPYILLGFFLQIIFEYASQGVEHGHIHHHGGNGTFPVLIFSGLCIHAFTEGLPLSEIATRNIFDSPLYWGILLHKVPVVIVLMSLFFAHDVKRWKMIAGLVVFSSLAPIGSLTGALLSGPSLNLIPYFLATSTGIFLHISTVIIFETSYNHRFNFVKFFFILAGGTLAIFLF